MKKRMVIVLSICILLLCVMIAVYVASGLVKKPWEISEEKQLKIKQDYLEDVSYIEHSCTVDDVFLAVISQVEDDYVVVIGCTCTSVDPDASWDDLIMDCSVRDKAFYVPKGWYIQYYKDGEFEYLETAFNLKWLNYYQWCDVWDDYNAQFPRALTIWERVYGDKK